MSTQIVENKTPVYIQAIKKAEPIFKKQSYANLMNYDEEAGHAIEILSKNKYSLKAAQDDPISVRRAVVKIASIGLSLNPALAYAYLVPRDGSICLDISYKGLVKLATDSGAIKWAKAELVRENDVFEYNGICALPTHSFDPFGERGNVKGVFCVAKTNDGDFLVDVMSLEEINEVRNTSKAKDSSYSPWNNFFGEMAKKTIIKRAQKMWPKGNDNRLEEAIQVLNEYEGLEKTEAIDHKTLEVDDTLKARFLNAYESENALEILDISQTASDEQWTILMKSFRTEITKHKKALDDLIVKGRAIFRDCIEAYKEKKAEDDDIGMTEIIEDMPSDFLKERLLQAVGEK